MNKITSYTLNQINDETGIWETNAIWNKCNFNVISMDLGSLKFVCNIDNIGCVECNNIYYYVSNFEYRNNTYIYYCKYSIILNNIDINNIHTTNIKFWDFEEEKFKFENINILPNTNTSNLKLYETSTQKIKNFKTIKHDKSLVIRPNGFYGTITAYRNTFLYEDDKIIFYCVSGNENIENDFVVDNTCDIRIGSYIDIDLSQCHFPWWNINDDSIWLENWRQEFFVTFPFNFFYWKLNKDVSKTTNTPSLILNNTNISTYHNTQIPSGDYSKAYSQYILNSSNQIYTYDSTNYNLDIYVNNKKLIFNEKYLTIGVYMKSKPSTAIIQDIQSGKEMEFPYYENMLFFGTLPGYFKDANGNPINLFKKYVLYNDIGKKLGYIFKNKKIIEYKNNACNKKIIDYINNPCDIVPYILYNRVKSINQSSFLEYVSFSFLPDLFVEDIKNDVPYDVWDNTDATKLLTCFMVNDSKFRTNTNSYKNEIVTSGGLTSLQTLFLNNNIINYTIKEKSADYGRIGINYLNNLQEKSNLLALLNIVKNYNNPFNILNTGINTIYNWNQFKYQQFQQVIGGTTTSIGSPFVPINNRDIYILIPNENDESYLYWKYNGFKYEIKTTLNDLKRFKNQIIHINENSLFKFNKYDVLIKKLPSLKIF